MGQTDGPESEDRDTMTLYLDDETQIECIVISRFVVNDIAFIALLPMNAQQEVDEDSQVWIYRYLEEEGEVVLQRIEDDDEFEMVTDYFDEMLDTEEFDSLFDNFNGIDEDE